MATDTRPLREEAGEDLLSSVDPSWTAIEKMKREPCATLLSIASRSFVFVCLILCPPLSFGCRDVPSPNSEKGGKGGALWEMKEKRVWREVWWQEWRPWKCAMVSGVEGASHYTRSRAAVSRTRALPPPALAVFGNGPFVWIAYYPFWTTTAYWATALALQLLSWVYSSVFC